MYRVCSVDLSYRQKNFQSHDNEWWSSKTKIDSMERNILIRNISEDCHRLHWLQSGFSSLPRWKRVKADFFCKKRKSIVYTIYGTVKSCNSLEQNCLSRREKWPWNFFSLYRGEETKINSKISTAKHSIE